MEALEHIAAVLIGVALGIVILLLPAPRWLIRAHCALGDHRGISSDGHCKACGASVDVTPREWR